MKTLTFTLLNQSLNIMPSPTNDDKLVCSILNFPAYLPEFDRTKESFDLALEMYIKGCKVMVICEAQDES